MDIKIPSGPLRHEAMDAVKDSCDAAQSVAETTHAAVATSDPVSRIAEQVARGEMERDEAIQQILSDIFGSAMVATAPLEIRQELEHVLQSLLETDPYLRSLGAAIGPTMRE